MHCPHKCLNPTPKVFTKYKLHVIQGPNAFPESQLLPPQGSSDPWRYPTSSTVQTFSCLGFYGYASAKRYTASSFRRTFLREISEDPLNPEPLSPNLCLALQCGTWDQGQLLACCSVVRNERRDGTETGNYRLGFRV